MRPIRIAALLATLTAIAHGQECTTSTTTSTTCRGSAAPLAAPPRDPVIEEVAPPTAYAPTPQAWAPPQPTYFPSPFFALPKTHVEQRPRYALIATGLAVFGGMYLLNASLAYVGDEGRLAVPLIGPILYADHRSHQYEAYSTGYGGGSSSSDRSFMALMVFDSLIQVAGAVLFIAGAISRTPVTVYDRIAILPTASSSGAGLAATGHF